MSLLGGKRVLVLALIAGLVTSFLVFSYMQKVDEASKPAETVSVLVAARDVPARVQFTEDMFVRRDIPVEAKHLNAVTRSDMVTGRITKLPLTAGEQVLSNKFFAERAESGLAFIVPPGKRAVSIGVTEVIGSGGLIVPGDDVDVVAVFDDKPFGQDAALFVLQKVSVLAVAQQLEGEEPPVDQGMMNQATQSLGIGGKPQPSEPPRIQPKAQPTARTATLAVQPDEALRLIMAEERGKIRLVLRPANEQSILEVPAIFLKGLRSANAPVGQPAPAAQPGQPGQAARAVNGVSVAALPTSAPVDGEGAPQ